MLIIKRRLHYLCIKEVERCQVNEKHNFLLKTVPLLAVGLALYFIYLLIFVDIPEMINVISRVDIPIYVLAIAALFIETTLFAFAWQYLLIPLSVKISIKKTFLYVWVGVFVDLLIPAESVSGDIAKVYLMSKEPDVKSGKVVASLITLRILGTITTTATLLVSFLTMLILYYTIICDMIQFIVVVTVMSALVFLLLIILCLKEDWAKRLVHKLLNSLEWLSRGRLKLEHFRTRIVEELKVFYKSLKVLGTKPTTLILPTVLTAFSWASSVAIVLLVFAAIGYSDPGGSLVLLLKTMVVYSLLAAIKSIPLGIPAEVGIPEIFMMSSFKFFGIPEGISAAATILTRIITVWLRFLVGFIAVQWLGMRRFIGSGGLTDVFSSSFPTQNDMHACERYSSTNLTCSAFNFLNQISLFRRTTSAGTKP